MVTIKSFKTNIFFRPRDDLPCFWYCLNFHKVTNTSIIVKLIFSDSVKQALSNDNKNFALENKILFLVKKFFLRLGVRSTVAPLKYKYILSKIVPFYRTFYEDSESVIKFQKLHWVGEIFNGEVVFFRWRNFKKKKKAWVRGGFWAYGFAYIRGMGRSLLW